MLAIQDEYSKWKQHRPTAKCYGSLHAKFQAAVPVNAPFSIGRAADLFCDSLRVPTGWNSWNTLQGMKRFIGLSEFTLDGGFQVYNIIPSISAITGVSPQRYLWRISVAFHVGPRFIIALVHRAYHLNLINPKADVKVCSSNWNFRFIDVYCSWISSFKNVQSSGWIQLFGLMYWRLVPFVVLHIFQTEKTTVSHFNI